MNRFLTSLFAHPLTRDRHIDDADTTTLRRDIIQSKPFFKKIYDEWYGQICVHFTPSDRVLELGSGAGFLKDRMPGLITSDVLSLPGVERIMDARELPFEGNSLDGIVMTNVLHHIPDCRLFFSEADRTLRRGGRIVMIEPWHTGWSRFVYTQMHHEPFLPDVADWTFPGSGPLSDANGALPWILFHRDRHTFESLFPRLQISKLCPMMPFSYLLSGGVSMRGILPGFLYNVVRWAEKRTVEEKMAMFACIALTKIK